MTIQNNSHNRNPGVAYDSSLFNDIKINKSAVERRVANLMGSRSLKKEHQVAWLLKAITCIDLTTLAGDDTPGNVARLCAKAKQPVRQDLLEALEMDNEGITVGAVCVYHNLIGAAKAALENTKIDLAVVSTGFPAGQTDIESKIKEIEKSVKEGATEIDIVISRAHVLTGNWKALYDEVKLFRAACGAAHLKTILATGELSTLTNVAKAGMVCMMAGADFIKTSTGKEPVNATLQVSLVMLRAIRAYYAFSGYRVGFKPAGGIRTAKQSLQWLILVKEELGNDWLNNKLFRFGASGLLTDIERQIEHFVTKRYSADYRHPMA